MTAAPTTSFPIETRDSLVAEKFRYRARLTWLPILWLLASVFPAALRAQTIDVSFNFETDAWGEASPLDIPVTVLDRGRGVLVWRGPELQVINLGVGNYMIQASHIYENGARRLQHNGIINVTNQDISRGSLEVSIVLEGSRLVGQRWVDDAQYEKDNKAFLAAQARRIQVQRQERERRIALELQASQLSEQLNSSIENSSLAESSALATELYRSQLNNPATRHSIQAFNERVCRDTLSTLVSTSALQQAKRIYGYRAGSSACLTKTKAAIDRAEVIATLETTARKQVANGNFVQAFATYGKIKRESGGIVDTDDLTHNLDEILIPLRSDKSHKPNLVVLALSMGDTR